MDQRQLSQPLSRVGVATWCSNRPDASGLPAFRTCARALAKRVYGMVVLSPVLYAEDESSDAFFMREAFTAAGIHQPLVTVPNGKAVLEYLQNSSRDRDKLSPCLLLLDLKLPLMDGFEVLDWLRQQTRWRNKLPIIVISSSGQQQDIKRALDMGADEYLIKPSDFNSLIPMVFELKRRWLGQALPLPRPAPRAGAREEA